MTLLACQGVIDRAVQAYVSLAVVGHLIVLGLNRGWPLLRSMFSLNLRTGDRSKHGLQQV